VYLILGLDANGGMHGCPCSFGGMGFLRINNIFALQAVSLVSYKNNGILQGGMNG
jgi:hypothetical protein